MSIDRKAEARPLRWLKFGLLLFFVSVAAAKALPVAGALARLWEASFVWPPATLLLAALGLLATAVLGLWLLLDAAFDLLMRRWAVALLVFLAALPWGSEYEL